MLNSKDWEKVLAKVPIPCVDLSLRIEEKGGIDKVLWIKRSHEPLKGCWALPGGRIFLHENIDEAINRIAKNEVGINVEYKPRSLLDAYSFDLGSRHDITLLYDIELKTPHKISINKSFITDYKLTQTLPKPTGDLQRLEYLQIEKLLR